VTIKHTAHKQKKAENEKYIHNSDRKIDFNT